MLNKTILMGRLVEDPELRTTPSGIKVCIFRVAVDRDYMTGDKRLADFFSVVAWRASGEFVSRHFKKGKPIIIEGRFENRVYLTKDGSKRYITELIVDQVNFAGDSANKNATGSAPSAPPPLIDGQAPADGSDFAEMTVDSNDLPF